MLGGGWIMTKKRGQDDAQIEKDKAKALEQRRIARGLKPKKPAANKKRLSGMDSLGGFIVEEEDVSEVELSSSEEEEELEVSKSIARKRTLDDASESSSDEEPDTFFKTYTKRTSRPPPARKLSTKKNTNAPKKKGNLKKKKEEVVDLCASSDDDVFFDCTTPAQAKSTGLDDEESSDDDLPSSSKLGKPTHSRYFNDNSKPTGSLKVDDDEDETPFQPAMKRKPQKKKKRQRIALDAEEVEDEDEANALAWALQDSMKEVKKQESQSPAPVEEHVVDLLEDDSDDNEDEQDEYADEDARAAGSVLETANALSAHVLQTMINWSAAHSGQNDGTSVPQGMIVDGALALSSMDVSSSASNSTEHEWISQDEMKTILPNVTLANYQLIGVNWLALLHSMKCEVLGKKSHSNVNGILADQMGLGKTVQTIAFLSWLKYTNENTKPAANGTGRATAVGSANRYIEVDDDDDDASVAIVSDDDAISVGPHLVIAPASVISNWEREFETFAPHLNVVKYHGSQEERDELKQELRIQLPGQERNRRRLGYDPVDVILAPITYFQKEKSDDRSFLRKFRYDYLVVDEAHLLKNARGQRYRTLDKFKTKHRLLLTGTPVQNSPKELMALLCFLMPLFAGEPEEFGNGTQNDGGERMLEHFVSLEGGKGETHDEAAYRKLKQLFAPFVLRRTKEDVLNQILPPKERKLELVEMDNASRELYDSIIARHVEAKKKANFAASREHLFTQLRKAANHPLLLRSRYTSPSEKEHLTRCFHQYGAFGGDGCTKAMVAEELDKYNDFRIHLTALELIDENPVRRSELEPYVLSESDLFCSAKFVRLRTLIPELIADGHRILIFSVWTSCLDLLGCLMQYLNVDFLRMEGSTPVEERQGLIDQFNSNTSIPVFLLSTKACGLGINLTQADCCIMHDLDFNPFNDLQAEDRCHRIGQKKKVTVFKMVSKDSVDEDIYMMQQRKAEMNAAIMENDWSKRATKEKEVVLKTAVDRFLKSPPSGGSRPSGAVAPAAATFDEKENETNADSTREII